MSHSLLRISNFKLEFILTFRPTISRFKNQCILFLFHSYQKKKSLKKINAETKLNLNKCTGYFLIFSNFKL